MVRSLVSNGLPSPHVPTRCVLASLCCVAGVYVTYNVSGIAANVTHGFHVHTWGDISSSTGMATAGHFIGDCANCRPNGPKQEVIWDLRVSVCHGVLSLMCGVGSGWRSVGRCRPDCDAATNGNGRTAGQGHSAEWRGQHRGTGTHHPRKRHLDAAGKGHTCCTGRCTPLRCVWWLCCVIVCHSSPAECVVRGCFASFPCFACFTCFACLVFAFRVCLQCVIGQAQTINRDCVVSGWSEWGSCTVACGGGVATRSRTILEAPGDNGSACGKLVDSQACNTTACGMCVCVCLSSVL